MAAAALMAATLAGEERGGVGEAGTKLGGVLGRWKSGLGG